jgi:uncharacterized membrane protein
MSRLKRVILSFASAIVAELIAGAVVSGLDSFNLIFEHIFGFIYFASFLVIPGWIIALPIVVLPKRVDDLQIWKLGLIGTSIGPGIMIAIGIYAAVASGTGLNYKHEAFNLLYLATVVSFLSTTIYLTALKVSIRDSIQSDAK